jgi:hypothetical protein
MLENLLETLARYLAAAQIPYMIIGGQAVLVYGEPRLTKDVDVTLGVGLDELKTITGLLPSMGLEPLVDPESFTRRTMVLPCLHPQSALRVDLIFSFTPWERGAISRSRPIRIGAVDVRFASLEDLIIQKIFAGRARDLEDVKGILRRNPHPDFDYIRGTLADFSEASNLPLLDRLEHVLAEP